MGKGAEHKNCQLESTGYTALCWAGFPRSQEFLPGPETCPVAHGCWEGQTRCLSCTGGSEHLDRWVAGSQGSGGGALSYDELEAITAKLPILSELRFSLLKQGIVVGSTWDFKLRPRHES